MSERLLADYAPMHILIVDDDAFIARIQTHHYRELGFIVDVAGDGSEALSMMEANLPDLVLCDRRMPGVSGADLLEIIRGRDAEWQAVIFVFVTGLADRRDRHAMIDLNPDGYLCKPIDFSRDDPELVRIIEKRRGVRSAK